MKAEPKNHEFWIVEIDGHRTVASIYRDGPRFTVYPCGDEEGYAVGSAYAKTLKWVRRVNVDTGEAKALAPKIAPKICM